VYYKEDENALFNAYNADIKLDLKKKEGREFAYL
jgi:hypothetical protein